MGKGQRLTEGEANAPYADMTVEDILRIVFKLAPQESTIAAVEKVRRTSRIRRGKKS